MNAIVDRYSEVFLRKAELAAKKQELIDQVITLELKAKLASIEFEFADAETELNQQLSEAEAEVKKFVLEAGETVKGQVHMAVYSKPRVSWDNKMLEGLALAIPQVNDAKTVGQPSVSIRLIK